MAWFAFTTGFNFENYRQVGNNNQTIDLDVFLSSIFILRVIDIFQFNHAINIRTDPTSCLQTLKISRSVLRIFK